MEPEEIRRIKEACRETRERSRHAVDDARERLLGVEARREKVRRALLDQTEKPYRER